MREVEGQAKFRDGNERWEIPGEGWFLVSKGPGAAMVGGSPVDGVLGGP